MVMHFQKRFYLRHGIEIDTDKDKQRCTAQQICHLAREIEQPLHQRRNQGDKAEVERAWQNDPVENSCQVFFHLFAANAGNRAAIFADILRNLLRVERHLRIEVREENNEYNIEEVIPESARPEPV